MEKDLGVFLIFLTCLVLIVSIFKYSRQELESQVAITAMEQGYCSSVHHNNSSIIWNKCKEENND